MDKLSIRNPFPGAASFLVYETDSTQEEAKRLAKLGLPPGSLVAAESQSGGRGRFADRRWLSEPGRNLLFTVRLDPALAGAPALPLRIGAALCRAATIAAIRMGRRPASPPSLKWPNDLVFGGRKAGGILCEACADGVYAGIGLNCNQTAFPGDLGLRATSLALELGAEVDRWRILEIFLDALAAELDEEDWRPGVEDLLWRRGEMVRFLPGIPGREPPVEGRLEGVDGAGSLLVAAPDGRKLAFAAGELLLEPAPGPAGELTAGAASYTLRT